MKKVLISFIFLMLASYSFAHSFHYEIQVTTTPIVNKSGELSGLNMAWLYDPEVSKALLQDKKDTHKLGKKLIEDLDVLGYFTQIKLNGKPLGTSMVKSYKLTKTGDNSLLLRFTLPLQKALKLSGTMNFELIHADPSATAILYYDNAKHLILEPSLKKFCRAKVEDKKKFAEGEAPQTVFIQCLVP